MIMFYQMYLPELLTEIYLFPKANKTGLLS